MSFLALLIVHEIYELAQPRRGIAAGFGGARTDFVKDGMIYGCVMLAAALLLRPSVLALFVALILFCARVAILSLTGYVARGRGATLKRLAFHEGAHVLILYLMARILPGAWVFVRLGNWLGVTIGAQALFVAFGYLTLSRPASVFVKLVLSHLRGSGAEETDGAGQIIGIIERLIIFTLGLSGQYAAIGFMIAAKSVARFEKFKEKDFAEIYIVGTLASIGAAVLLSSVYSLLP